MAKNEDFKLLKIQTHVLRVNIHCDGCRDKVKKLLTKIEGVFSVNIDVDLQKVSVVGNVDADTLIRKLNRAGKYAAIWSNKPNNNNSNYKNSNNAPQKNQKQNNAPQNQKHVQIHNPNAKDQGKQNLMQGLKTFKNQHKGGKVPDLYSDDELSDEFDDDDDEDFDEEDLRMLGEKMGQLNFLRQMNGHAQAVNNHANNNKNLGNNNNANNNNNNGKKNGNTNGNGNNGKKNPNGNNQNQQGKTANVQGGLNFAGVNGKMMPSLGPLGGDQGKRVNALNGMHGMMGGLHGANDLQTNVNGGPMNHQNHGSMMMGMHHHHPSTMVAGNNNMRNGNMMMMHDGARFMQQQPQVMYARSPQVTPYTGYYGYNPNPNLYYGYNNNNNNSYYASPYHGEPIKNDGIGYMFSDENTKGCAIM